MAEMPLGRTILLIVLSASLAGAATAQSAAERRETVHPQLRGLSSAEAEALIRNLQQLQTRLRNGKDLFFELLSGAPASYPMTTVSPREAFLRMPFESAVSIERVQTTNQLWQPYKLFFAPNGPGQSVWDVEVVLGFHGQVERVQMIYKPPAPF